MTQSAGDLPQELGRYRLDAFIGEGGMGRVYRAFDPSLGRPVAIKILPPELIHDRDRLVWLQPLDGSPARPVTHFDDQYVLEFDVMPGGKELAVVRGVLSRDAVLIKNFR